MSPAGRTGGKARCFTGAGSAPGPTWLRGPSGEATQWLCARPAGQSEPGEDGVLASSILSQLGPGQGAAFSALKTRPVGRWRRGWGWGLRGQGLGFAPAPK